MVALGTVVRGTRKRLAGSALAESLLGVLDLELEGAETSTTNPLDESKFVANLKQTFIPMVVFVRHNEHGSALALEEGGHTLGNKLVGDQADNHTNGK
jgi:hypothetical protein